MLEVHALQISFYYYKFFFYFIVFFFILSLVFFSLSLLLLYFFSFSLLFVIFSFTAHRLQQGLQEYAEYVMERARLEDLMAVNDPRSEEEKILAADLLSTAISQRPEPIESGEDVFCRHCSFSFLLFLLCPPEIVSNLVFYT